MSNACPSCGVAIIPGYVNCPRCRKRLTSPPPAPSIAPHTAPVSIVGGTALRERRRMPWFWLITGAAAAVLAIALVVERRSESSLPPPPTKPPAFAQASPDPRPQWWCWADKKICAASLEQCRWEVQRVNPKRAGYDVCVARDVAYCSTECEAGMTACLTSCSHDRDTCLRHKGGTCDETRPLRFPHVYPAFMTPGWWCFTLPAQTDAGPWSVCTKDQIQCENQLDAGLLKAGWTRASVPDRSGSIACARPTAPVQCFEFVSEGVQMYMCSESASTCRAQASIATLKFPDASACAAWPFD